MGDIGSTLSRLGFHPADYPGPVRYVGLGQFVNVFGSGVVFPFATLYFVDFVGVTAAVVGAGLFANSILRGVGTVLGGYLADRVGRVPVMVASMGASALALSAYALVTTGVGFAAVAAVAGLVGGLYTPASHAMVADITAGGDREQSYGLLKVTNNLGFGLGFVAGGLLFGVAHRAVFVVDGITSALVAVLLFAVLPRVDVGAPAPLRAEFRRWRSAVSRPALVHLALLNVGFAVMYAQMGSTVPLVANRTLGLDSRAIGLLFVLNPLVIVLFQLPAVTWARRWRRTRGLLLSTGFWAAGFAAVVLVYAVPVEVGVALLGGFLVLRTLGEVLHSPLTSALAADLGPAETRGTQLSVVELSKRVGFGVGPLVGLSFFDYGVEAWLWPAIVGLCVLVGVGLLALEARLEPGQNGVTAGTPRSPTGAR